MKLTVSVEAERLNRAFALYQQASSRTIGEMLAKQGKELSFKLGESLRAIAPAKGSIRSAQMARFHAGEGIRVSKWVKDRIKTKFNVFTSVKTRREYGVVRLKKSTKVLFGHDLWQKMVEAEINSRESGRGFLAQSAKFRGKDGTIRPGTQASFSKFGPVLAKAGLSVSARTGTLRISWGGSGALSVSAAQGLTTPKGQAAVAEALAATTANILVYVKAKTNIDLKKAGFE